MCSESKEKLHLSDGRNVQQAPLTRCAFTAGCYPGAELPKDCRPSPRLSGLHMVTLSAC